MLYAVSFSCPLCCIPLRLCGKNKPQKAQSFSQGTQRIFAVGRTREKKEFVIRKLTTA